MIEHSPSIAALSTALHGAQAVMTGVVKDARNPHFKTRYATLEAVLDTARPALQAHGLMVTQAPGHMVDGCVEITTMLAHVSGEWMRSTLHVPLAKRDPQGLGSAITYGCRYALMAALGMPPTDDDAEAAMPERKRADAGPAKGVASPPPEADPAQREFVRSCKARIAEATDTQSLGDWWKGEDLRQQISDFGLSDADVAALRNQVIDRVDALKARAAA